MSDGYECGLCGRPWETRAERLQCCTDRFADGGVRAIPDGGRASDASATSSELRSDGGQHEPVGDLLEYPRAEALLPDYDTVDAPTGSPLSRAAEARQQVEHVLADAESPFVAAKAERCRRELAELVCALQEVGEGGG